MTVVMNFSGIYENQKFYKQQPARILDLRHIPGTNCYCDDAAKEKLLDVMEKLPVSDIHFLDSGNYHYLSRLWLQKMTEAFVLLVFDNHTDMQPPAFGGLLSCGGWIAAAIEELPLLQKVILVGPDENAFSQVPHELKDRVIFLSREALVNRKTKERRSMIRQSFMELPSELPVYISVDKDILSTAELKTNWSQGDLCTADLMELVGDVMKMCNIAGMDVCGEDDICDLQSLQASDDINASLQKLWLNRRETDAE